MISALLQLEWSKWWGRRDARWAVAFLLVGIVGYALVLRALAEAGLQLLPGEGVETSGYHLAYRALRGMLAPLGLFLLMWSAGSVAGELEHGTARGLLLRVSRPRYALAKATLFAGVAAALLALLLGLALAAGAATYGLHGVRAGSIVLHSAIELARAGVAATALSALPMITLVALGMWASCVARSLAAALTMAMVAACVLWAASLIPALQPWVFSSTIGSPLAVAVGQTEGLRTQSLADGLTHHLIVNLAWTAGLIGAGIARLSRRDLP